MLLAWSICSSLWVYPHSISYFNEIAGGPRGGHNHLGGVAVDSNIDSGQDLLHLRRWLAKHPEAHPISLAFNGVYDAHVAGLSYTLPPPGPAAGACDEPSGSSLRPVPGWHAVSVNQIRSGTSDTPTFSVSSRWPWPVIQSTSITSHLKRRTACAGSWSCPSCTTRTSAREDKTMEGLVTRRAARERRGHLRAARGRG